MKSTNNLINLDWAKLMGFNQIASAKSGAGKKVARAAIGAKVGAKGGGGGGGTPPAE